MAEDLEFRIGLLEPVDGLGVRVNNQGNFARVENYDRVLKRQGIVW